jgi:hypothetical protein
MQTIYGLINECGDGSSSIHWYRNEGTPAETLTFPDDLDLAAAGFYFTD